MIDFNLKLMKQSNVNAILNHLSILMCQGSFKKSIDIYNRLQETSYEHINNLLNKHGVTKQQIPNIIREYRKAC